MDHPPGIAWEREGSFFTRLWDSVAPATIDPVTTFRTLGDEGSSSKAVSLALITALIGNAPYLLCAPCLALIPLAFMSVLSTSPLAAEIPEWVRGIGMGAACAGVAAFPALIVLISLTADLAYGLVFHVLCRLFGGRGTLNTSLRAGFYAGIIRFWLWPILLVAFIPMIGTILQIAGRLLLVVWTGVALYGAAAGLHSLDQNRSIAVGVLTPLIALGMMASLWGGTLVLIWGLIAGGLHALPSLPH